MPLPQRLARFNRRVTNPVARVFAGRIPPFAIAVHRGRRSGREFRTPVWCFGSGSEIVIALTYGSSADWVKNMLAADGGGVIRGGRRAPARAPRVIGQADGLPRVGFAVRPFLRLLNVTEFLLLELDDEEASRAVPTMRVRDSSGRR